jgi:hypothetical protein
MRDLDLNQFGFTITRLEIKYDLIGKQAEDPFPLGDGMNAVCFQVIDSYKSFGLHPIFDGENKICMLQYQLSSCLDT